MWVGAGRKTRLDIRCCGGGEGARCHRTNCEVKLLERKTGFSDNYAPPMIIRKVSEAVALLIMEFFKASSGMRDADRLKDGKPQSPRKGLGEQPARRQHV